MKKEKGLRKEEKKREVLEGGILSGVLEKD